MLRTEAKITQLITDFARLDPAADGSISIREFKAALKKHGGFLDRVGDSLATRFGVSRRPDLPSTEVDYVAFLAYLEDAVEEQKQKHVTSITPPASANNALRERIANQNHQHQPSLEPQQQQKQPELQPKKLSFVDRALNNASKAVLNHHHNNNTNSCASTTNASSSNNSTNPTRSPSTAVASTSSHLHYNFGLSNTQVFGDSSPMASPTSTFTYPHLVPSANNNIENYLHVFQHQKQPTKSTKFLSVPSEKRNEQIQQQVEEEEEEFQRIVREIANNKNSPVRSRNNNNNHHNNNNAIVNTSSTSFLALSPMTPNSLMNQSTYLQQNNNKTSTSSPSSSSEKKKELAPSTSTSTASSTTKSNNNDVNENNTKKSNHDNVIGVGRSIDFTSALIKSMSPPPKLSSMPISPKVSYQYSTNSALVQPKPDNQSKINEDQLRKNDLQQQQPVGSSSSSSTVSLAQIFSLIDKDNKGYVTLSDIVYAFKFHDIKNTGRLEIEFLIEGVLLSSSCEHLANNATAVEHAKLDKSLFSVFVSRLKPETMNQLRDPSTWSGSAKKNSKSYGQIASTHHQDPLAGVSPGPGESPRYFLPPPPTTRNILADEDTEHEEESRKYAEAKFPNEYPRLHQQQTMQSRIASSSSTSSSSSLLEARRQEAMKKKNSIIEEHERKQQHPSKKTSVTPSLASFMKPTTSSSLRTGEIEPPIVAAAHQQHEEPHLQVRKVVSSVVPATRRKSSSPPSTTSTILPTHNKNKLQTAQHHYQRSTVQSQQQQQQRSTTSASNSRSTSRDQEHDNGKNRLRQQPQQNKTRAASSSVASTTNSDDNDKRSPSTPRNNNNQPNLARPRVPLSTTTSTNSNNTHNTNTNKESADAKTMSLLSLFKTKSYHVSSLCQVVDVRRRGYIYLDKMIEVLQTISPSSSSGDLRNMLSKYFAHQKNNFLVVDYSEFIAMIGKLPVPTSTSSTTSAAAEKSKSVETTKEKQQFEQRLSSAQEHLFGVSSPSSSPSPQSQREQNRPPSLDSPSTQQNRIATEEGRFNNGASPSSSPPQSQTNADTSSASRQRQQRQQQQQDVAATETLRQMLRTELDKVSENNPQTFIDCLLEASTSSSTKKLEQHRNRDIWMIKVGQLEQALAALYAFKTRTELNAAEQQQQKQFSNNNMTRMPGSPSASSSPASRATHHHNNLFALPPEWVVTRSRKIAQVPLLVLAAGDSTTTTNAATANLLSSSAASATLALMPPARVKEFKKKTKEWLMTHPEIIPEEWCDVSYLLETIYLV